MLQYKSQACYQSCFPRGRPCRQFMQRRLHARFLQGPAARRRLQARITRINPYGARYSTRSSELLALPHRELAEGTLQRRESPKERRRRERRSLLCSAGPQKGIDQLVTWKNIRNCIDSSEDWGRQYKQAKQNNALPDTG